MKSKVSLGFLLSVFFGILALITPTPSYAA